MEQQSTEDPLRHTNIDMVHIGNGVKGNFRYPSNVGRVIKREMVDEFKYDLSNAKLESPRDVLSGFDIVSMSTMTQRSDFKDRQSRRISLEAEAGAWLRDEPMDDIAKGGGLHTSPSASLGGRDCGGSGSSEGKTESGGFQCLADGSWSPGCAQDVSEDAAPQQGSSTTASLLAQLRATKIKESVILDAIQRYGGGQKGLRGVIKAIMFWLAARNRFTSQSSDPCISQSPSPPPVMEEVDQLPWSNTELGSLVDVQSGPFGNFNDALPADPTCMMNSSFCRDDSGSLCDLKRGGSSSSGEQGQLPNRENQVHVCTGEIGTCAPLPQVSGFPQKGVSSLSSGNWVFPKRDYMLRHENMSRARMIRKLSPSPDRSGLHGPLDVPAYDDSVSHKNKIRRHSPSPAGFTSFQCSSDVPAYGSAAPVAEISGTPGIVSPVGANPFAPGGPFSLSPSSPPPMDAQFSDFALGMNGSIYVEDNLGMGSSAQGCGRIDRLGSFGYPVSSDSSDQKNSGPQLGVLAKVKSVPAACTRLARKNRMDRNRKAALFQVNRGTFETGALLAGKTGGMWSSGSLRTSSRSQGSPASEGQACRTKDRRDQEHLQFLLQKVLRPSDVGNLGRIVLPKKDAECHLPWLGAREGIQFACEDYDTGEKMALRYRFWPNNKSRMYLLENTGDFVKKHQLQESDRMLIYRNRQEGIYVIRARKARDCVGGLPSKVHTEEMGGEGTEIREQNSPGGTGSSGTLSSDREVETPESNVCSGLEGAPEPPVLGMVTSQDDLLNLADLPDAPMGEGTVNLVRFPSLESFDVELLELGPAVIDKQDGRSCVLIPDGD